MSELTRGTILRNLMSTSEAYFICDHASVQLWGGTLACGYSLVNTDKGWVLESGVYFPIKDLEDTTCFQVIGHMNIVSLFLQAVLSSQVARPDDSGCGVRLIDANALHNQVAGDGDLSKKETRAAVLLMIESAPTIDLEDYDFEKLRAYEESLVGASNRLIDAGVANQMLIQGYEIDDVPTVDAQPVVHGHWIRGENKSAFPAKPSVIWYCSYCGEMIRYNDSTGTYQKKKKKVNEIHPRCRRCGARMSGGIE